MKNDPSGETYSVLLPDSNWLAAATPLGAGKVMVPFPAVPTE